MRRSAGLPTAILAALVAVSSVAGCRESETSVQVGTVFAASVPRGGTTITVVTPSGQISFTVGEPSRHIKGDNSDPTEGASFVPVTWTVGPGTGPAVSQDLDLPDVVPSFALVAGGRAYPLDGQMIRAKHVEYTGDLVATVAGSPSPRELAVRVDYDGLTQQVPLRGAASHGVAQALYDHPDGQALLEGPGRKASNCGPLAVDDPRFTAPDAHCALEVVAVPYQRKVGWVRDPADSWLVVHVLDAWPGNIVNLNRPGQRPTPYTAGAGTQVTATYGGKPPAAVTDSGEYVFDLADGGPLVVTTAFTGRRLRPRTTPIAPQIVLTWSSTLPTPG